jgi:fibronectin type 3 domain-containing protein
MRTKRAMGNRHQCWMAFMGMALALFGATCTRDTHDNAPTALLQARFPAHADRVLGAAGGTALVAAADGNGFVPAPPAGTDPVKAAQAALTARGGLRSILPAKGDGAVRFSLPDGFAIEAREQGPRRAGRIQGNAVVYDHGAGASTSFWSATGSGLEEWLLVPASGEAPVATWDVSGATLRQNGEAVEVVDGKGTARLTVTAPAAYAEGGAPLRTRLAADGARLALSVEGAVGAGMVLVDPEWQVTGSMGTARVCHTATLLPSGKVLVAGGQGSPYVLASAELYDPAAGTFAPTTGSMTAARRNHTATMLPSGKVLLAGGHNGSAYGTLASAELYDPVADTFASTTGFMATTRREHTATLLESGKVLVVGGISDGSYYPSFTAELYDPVEGTFTTTGYMATRRDYHTATLLPSGKVLVVGGYGNSTGYLASAELYDPVSGAFAATTGPMSTARTYHTATLLSSGKVLVAGGENDTGPLASAELYDPVAGTFAPTIGSLATARRNHTATLLPSGKVLVVGGKNDTGAPVSAEVYYPMSETFSPAADPIETPRSAHTATLLPSGKVFVAGGGSDDDYLASAALYDWGDNYFATTGSMATAREGQTTTLLPSGKVLVAGGWNGSGLTSAELYDPAAGTFAPTGPMAHARAGHTATLLATGKVLVAGGLNSGYLASAELYDPVAGTFASTGPMATARENHTATLLPSGKVLMAGGYNGGALVSAELYDPVAGTFAPTTGPLATPRRYHTSTLLSSGKVLVVGGRDGSSLASAELYDSAASTFVPTSGPLATARCYHTATLLPSGKVLVAGGVGSTNYLNSAELYDPVAGTFATSGSLWTPRYLHTATLLPSGKVLVVGGRGYPGDLDLAETYDPMVSSFMPTIWHMATARIDHTAALLPSGKVLVAGGYNTSNGYLVSADLYDEGRGAEPGWTPTLDGPLPSVIAGATLALTGTRFTGVSAASSGNTQTSDTNFPLVLVMRVDNQQLAYLPTTGFTATSATAAVPATLTPGRYVAWVVANGVLSNGAGLSLRGLTAPTGVSASDGTYTDKVEVSFSPVGGVTFHQVFRNTSNSSSGATFIGAAVTTPFDDTTATPGTIYYYFVQACGPAGCTDFSASDSGYRKISPPTGVSASDGTHADRVAVSWTAAAGATSYEVYRGTPSGATDDLGSATATSYDDTTATPGTTYYYFVKACSAAGCSDYSASDSGYRGMSPPTVTASDGTYTDRVQLSWSASTGATSYQVYRNASNSSGGAAQLGTPTATFFYDTTATPGTTYYYFVKACGAAGCSDYSASDPGYRMLLPPAPPTGVSASDGTYTDRVAVSWNESSGATSYELYRNTANSSGGATQIGTPEATSHDDATVAAGAIYYYFVKACNSGGCSGFDGSDSGYRAMTVPRGVTASDGSYADKVRISWNNPVGTTSCALYRNTSNSSSGATLLGSSGAPPYDDTTATPGAIYYYFVKACNQAVCSDFSTSDSGYRAMSAPTVTASDGTDTDKVAVSWTPSSGATSYQLWRNTSDSPGGATQLGGTLAVSRYDDTSATAGTLYYYFVKACASAVCSDFSIADSGYRRMPAPKGVTASDGTYPDKVQVAWTAPSGPTSYQVHRNTFNSSFGATLIGRPATSPYDDRTATPGTTYYYFVKACASAGCSDFSASDSGYRAGVPDPVVVTASDGNYLDKVAVSWNTPSGATSYELYRNTSDSSSGATQLGRTLTEPSYDDTTAIPGTIYYYFVKACSVAGCSDFGTPDSGYRAMTAPSRVSASDGSHPDKVEVSWTASSGATSYEVYRNTSDSSDGASLLRTPTASPYDDRTARPGVTYYYFVKACNETVCSDFSGSDSGYRAMSSPTVTASDGTYTDKVEVSWIAASGATSYEVYRSTTDSSGDSTQIGTVAASPYDDTTAAPGTTYYYFVKACNEAVCSDFGTPDSGYRSAGAPEGADAGTDGGPEAGADADAEACHCEGAGPGGNPVTAACGESACGSDYSVYSCSADGWAWTGQTCTGDSDAGTACQCSGAGSGGNPVTVNCGQTACGSDYQTYACSSAGWSWSGQACTGNSDAGGACQCSGAGPNGVPVTVDCGQTACGSDYATYACGSAGWSWIGQPCTSNCQCTGTGPGGVPLTVECGQSACGSDYQSYACSSAGWSWTGQACTGNSDAGGACQCSGTGSGGVPLTVDCGQTACGSDYQSYACSSAGWSWTGQACTGNHDAGGACQCSGTGAGGVPVTVDCGQTACGSDYQSYACGSAGWSWTGQTCP